MKKICVALLLILLASTTVSADGKLEGEGFDSAEDAVSAYIKGIQDSDIDEMLSAYAIETFAENYSLEASIDRSKSYAPYYHEYIPNSGAMSFRINVETRRAELTSAIRNQFLVLTDSKALLDNLSYYTIPVNEEQEIKNGKEFVETMFASDESPYFDDIRFDGEFIDPGELSSNYDREANQKQIRSNADIIGADEIKSVVSKFYRGTDEFLLMMDCARYGDKWYLYTSNSNIGLILNVNRYYEGILPLKGISLIENQSY